MKEAKNDRSGSRNLISELEEKIERYARVPHYVLITGERGTGKTTIARQLHEQGARSAREFVNLNCASLTSELLESELFGYEKGAFTGATAPKAGLFEIASGGTLFLDEIGEMDISLQAKLLRALQEKSIRRVGGTRELKTDVRVVAATNRDLRKMADDGRFREDLYYRLNVLAIDLAPLRERRSDIPVLIDYFLKKHTRGSGQKIKGFAPDARKALLDYHYPGNVRQLESAIERAVLLAEGELITLDDLPPEIAADERPSLVLADGFKLPAQGINWEEVERSLILQAMERTDNNITKAAKLLGLTFRTLQYRLEKFGVKREASDSEESEE
jgi:transcriptional regulator with PAS, ATPase and Fis domain